MIKELTEHIRDNMSTDVMTPTIGTNLFAGKRPTDAPVTCVTVLERVPSVPNPLLPDTFQKPVQILARGPDYFTTRALAFDVHDIIFGINNAVTTLGPLNSGGDIYQINIATGDEPASLDDDSRERFEFTANYLIKGQKNP